jgi:hypothetical protein
MVTLQSFSRAGLARPSLQASYQGSNPINVKIFWRAISLAVQVKNQWTVSFSAVPSRVEQNPMGANFCPQDLVAVLGKSL